MSVLKDSTLSLSLPQQKAIRKKIHQEDSNIIVRELVKEEEAKIEPEVQAQPANFTETRINCVYYKL